MTTPISQLLEKEDEMPPPPQQPPSIQNPSAQFGNLPGRPDARPPPPPNMMPTGMGQGLSMPEGPSRKEFFGLKELDWRSAILVFAIVLILSSGLFAASIRPYVPGSVGSDGRTTLIGSLLAAIIGVVIFVIVKLAGKF